MWGSRFLFRRGGLRPNWATSWSPTRRWYLDGRSGSAAYDAGHIEGAIFVDLDRCLSGRRPARPAGTRFLSPLGSRRR